MNDDVRNYIYGALIVFLTGITIWIGVVYINACGLSLSCKRGEPTVERTPVPTLIPANLPASENSLARGNGCQVAATDLLGAWVQAGAPESSAFEFMDIQGRECQADFGDVQPLFIESNVWYSGSHSCATCHFHDLETAAAQLDLGSYAGILAGSRRTDSESQGTPIFQSTSWTSSLLYDFIAHVKEGVAGHEAINSQVILAAGRILPASSPAATPTSVMETTPTPTP